MVDVTAYSQKDQEALKQAVYNQMEAGLLRYTK
jgi:hypothetical protein